jgi:hypothetical protein
MQIGFHQTCRLTTGGLLRRAASDADCTTFGAVCGACVGRNELTMRVAGAWPLRIPPTGLA